MKKITDFYFEVPDCGSPITILQGRKTKKSIEVAASLTAHYSDNSNPAIIVNYGRQKLDKTICVVKPIYSEIKKLRIF